MPIWLRKFTYSRIAEHYQNQNEQVKKASAGSNTHTLMDSDGNVDRSKLQQQNLSKVQYQ